MSASHYSDPREPVRNRAGAFPRVDRDVRARELLWSAGSPIDSKPLLGQRGVRMTDLMTQAAWILLGAFALSLVYELYRATTKAGTSRHDSMQSFVRNNVGFYIVATIVIALLFAGPEWAAWIGLLFSGGAIIASIVYYNPIIMLARAPGIIDWFEDIVFTGLLFAAATLLLYDVLGVTLEP
jgi:hypothetical protein